MLIHLATLVSGASYFGENINEMDQKKKVKFPRINLALGKRPSEYNLTCSTILLKLNEKQVSSETEYTHCETNLQITNFQ